LLTLLIPTSFGQIVPQAVTKDDWEEINFEFDSAMLVDGFPSLLRIAELLKGNPTFKVKVDGHADGLGTNDYNVRLGTARANSVKDFLLKYGAAASQVEVTSKGETDPRARPEKPRYSRTDEVRWVNRRVVLTVLDSQGRTVSAGGAGDTVRALKDQVANGGMRDCCTDVLKRLDLLDEILRRLKEVQDQNAALKKDMDELKALLASKGTGSGTGTGTGDGAAGANNSSQSATNTGAAGGGSATGASAGSSANSGRPTGFSGSPFINKFSLLGANVGPDSNGKVTFTGAGRFFAPMGDNFAVQAQGEYLYFRTQKEAQFDLGLVNRLGRFQAGLFGSFKHVKINELSGGTLGQAALTADYLFSRGRVGVFGTKGFMDEPIVGSNRVVLSNGSLAANLIREQYLRIVDQAGVSGTVALLGNTYAEGNIGYLKAYGSSDRVGGTLRFIFPINDHLAFTAEGGVNETFMGRSGSTGRAVFGVQFGNLLRPKDFVASGRPVPVQVPRVRYELLSRTVRTGALQPPVADAGPDQIGVTAGLIRLDGSNSYDPNGERLTYQWIQEAGPQVSLSGAANATTTFTSAAGQVYVFRLTVRNESGLQASARVRVTTRTEDRVQILFFIANPTVVRQGATSELSWKVLNADEVTLETVGTVGAEGRAQVIVNQNTTYRLTAKNRTSEETSSVTVTVERPETRVVSCFATPTNVTLGESSTISYLTENATSVTIAPGVGSVQPSGTVTVTPTSTTTYSVLAAGVGGQVASCNVTITVNPRQGMPRIVRFTADPSSINEGQKSTLTWTTEGADTVSISTFGSVEVNGVRDVMPTVTTTYVLTATNAAGSTTASAIVTVVPGVRINSFTADPPVSPAPGSKVLLTCLARNAISIDIQPNNGQNITAQTLVYPQQDTTYTCTAIGPNNTRDVRTLTVTVTRPPVPPGPDPNVPVITIEGGPVIETNVRQVTLNASAISPTGDLPLSYRWTSPGTQAAIQTPNAASTIVQLNQLIGDFIFEVEVTDARGRKATRQVVVRLIKRPVI
jgi:hypothetical protein